MPRSGYPWVNNRYNKYSDRLVVSDSETDPDILPPENELQKGLGGERVLSEHQLRVQRSLQKLNVPDWYKNSAVAREGFTLHKSSMGSRDHHQGWPGLSSKTTSLSSLGHTSVRSPTTAGQMLLSPSPVSAPVTGHIGFSRWSTSRLNSTHTSTSTSPCGSTRSSFNYRQPYLGWRSQERLAKPRTPAERLAAGLLPATSPTSSTKGTSPQLTPSSATTPILGPQQQHPLTQQQAPSLSEVHSSIKEVTSAIVHYVAAGASGGSSNRLHAENGDISPARSNSPRGSQRLCWLESSFVGTRPLDSPETPSTITGTDPVTKTIKSNFDSTPIIQSSASTATNNLNNTNKSIHPSSTPTRSSNERLCLELRNRSGTPTTTAAPSGHATEAAAEVGSPAAGPDVMSSWSRSSSGGGHLYHSHYSSHHHHHHHHHEPQRPSPTSTTLEDVLDSLLGLPSASRSPSPTPAASAAGAAPSAGCCTPPVAPPPPPPPPPCLATAFGDIRGDIAGSVSGSESPAGGSGCPSVIGTPIRRRRSEGEPPVRIGPPHPPPPPPPRRRVSFDVASTATSAAAAAASNNAQPYQEPMMRCRYGKCGKEAPTSEARRTFKTCHNCAHTYCSRECRRAHWERHRKTCLHSRVGALCRQVLAAARDDPGTLRHLSGIARRGFLSHGRGAVKAFFSSPETAETFVAGQPAALGEPAFVRWPDLLPAEMGPQLYAELVRLCKTYNPDTRFVLYVAVCVVSEVPTSGAVKWERQLVSRCAKLRLCRSLLPTSVTNTTASVTTTTTTITTTTTTTTTSTTSSNTRFATSITREMDNPETLILTSLPGVDGRLPDRRARELCFANIQKQLRSRGVSVRRQFPDVHRRLVAYVDGTVESFTPVTIYPREGHTGKPFMCIIMPEAEPERLHLLPRDSARVRTIDIGQDPAGAAS